MQVAAGQIGQPPAASAQQFQYTVTTLGRLSDAEEFEDIVVKTEGGRITRLRDVARVELGSQNYDQYFLKDGKPAAGIGIYPLPGANALETADRVRATMERMKPAFPEGVAYSVPLDTTLFVRSAIREVYWTLFEASALVLIVILVFLQDWRAVLVPATTVPVTIIGAFVGMAAFGFTVNLLTLFGLVLAIGIVVDDAIVIVENASHHIDVDKLPPREATIKAMGEVTAPIMGITTVLMSVFLPAVFLGGITGQLYRQFALTIAVTAVISAINAVTLKPAQCAVWLRPTSGYHNAFFRGFNRGLRAHGGVLRRAGLAHAAQAARDARRVRGAARRNAQLVPLAAHGLPAGRGPGLRDLDDPAPGRRVPGPHARRRHAHERDLSRRAGRRRREHDRRLLDPRRQRLRECGFVLRDPAAVGPASQARSSSSPRSSHACATSSRASRKRTRSCSRRRRSGVWARREASRSRSRTAARRGARRSSRWSRK